jgi:HEAT repeat protein
MRMFSLTVVLWGLYLSGLCAQGPTAPAPGPQEPRYYGRTFDELKILAEDNDPQARTLAAKALRYAGEPAIPILIKLLWDEDDCTRSCAIDSLGKIGREANTMPKAIIGLLYHQDENIRRSGLKIMGRMGPKAKTAVPALVELLGSKDSTVRDTSTWVLSEIGMIPETTQAIPALIKLIKDKETVGRIPIGRALARLQPPSAPFLTDLLQDNDKQVRLAAVNGLLQYDLESEKAISVLVGLLDDQEVGGQASSWLDDIGPNAKVDMSAVKKFAADENQKVRIRAINVLKKMGAEAVSTLAELTHDADAEVRDEAAKGLGYIGPAAVPTLIELLRDKEAKNRKNAAIALRDVAPAAKTAIPALVELWKDENPNVHKAVFEALNRIGLKQVIDRPDFKELMQSEDFVQRSAAISAWSALGADAIPKLIELLKDKEPKIRFSAVEALLRIDPKSKAVLSALLEFLRSDDADVRAKAANLLARSDSNTKVVIPAISELLVDKDRKVLLAAVVALHRMETEAKAYVPALTNLLQDNDPRVRGMAAELLVHIDPDAKNLIPTLIELLQHDAQRSWAAIALGKLGPKAEPAIPELVKLVGQMQTNFPTYVGDPERALGQIGQASISAVMPLLQSKDIDVRCGAVQALGQISRQSKVKVPILAELLADNDIRIRLAAASALARSGVEASKATPVLIAMLYDPDEKIVEMAAEVLGELGSEAKTAVPTLAFLLRDADHYHIAMSTLIKLDIEAVPAVMELLQDQEESVVVRASKTLGDIGPAAKAATVKLTELLDRKEWKDWGVRLTVAEALGKIDPGSLQAFNTIIESLQDKEKYVRMAAIEEGLRRMEPPPKSTITAFTELLHFNDPNVRQAAENALKVMQRSKQ